MNFYPFILIGYGVVDERDGELWIRVMKSFECCHAPIISFIGFHYVSLGLLLDFSLYGHLVRFLGVLRKIERSGEDLR